MHDSGIQSMVISEWEQILLSCDKFGCLNKVNLATNRIDKFPTIHKSSITSLALSYDGRWLFSADLAANVYQWKLDDMGFYRVVISPKILCLTPIDSLSGRWSFPHWRNSPNKYWY